MIPCHPLLSPLRPSGGILSTASGPCTPVVALSLFLKSEPCPGEPILRLLATVQAGNSSDPPDDPLPPAAASLAASRVASRVAVRPQTDRSQEQSR